MERYGYIRVSAKDQNPERQFLAMQEQQIRQENIYLDKMSGKSFARPQWDESTSMHLESKALSVTAVAVSSNVVIHPIVSKLTSNDAKLSGMARSQRAKWCKNGVVDHFAKKVKGGKP